MDGAHKAQLTQADVEILSALTDMEQQILKLIFDGVNSTEVAQVMQVSKRTVDFHLAEPT